MTTHVTVRQGGKNVISGFSQHALSQLQGALGGGGGSTTTVVIDFERLANEVARLRATASMIAQAVMNPTWAAGDEMCRRAGTALENEWFDEAANDAQRSVEAYPYRAAPYLFLALAQLHRGDSVAAYQSLLKAIEFGKAAEPEQAATAGLLAANMAAGAGRPDDASAVLLKARDSTKSRCPDLVVATQVLRPSSPAELCQLLKDNPAAWVDIPVPESSFGKDGEAVRSAFDELVTAALGVTLEAEDFTRRTAQLTPDDVDFLSRLSDRGSMRYSGAIDALNQYKEGGCMRLLRPFAESVDEARSSMSLAVAIHTGHVLLRYLAWRIPTRLPVSEDWLGLRFDRVASEENMQDDREPDVLGDGPVRDILVSDWFMIDRDVRLHDRPRMVGQAEGTGPYLRALRAQDKFHKDAADLRLTESSLANQREPKGFRRRDEQRWFDENRQKLARIHRFLALPPPDLGPLQGAIARWVQITTPTSEPVIRPYANIPAPP